MTHAACRLVWMPLLAMLLVSPAAALEKYLCIADQSTGFKWDGSEWVTASFRIDNMKFVVYEVAGNAEVNFEVKQVGEEFPRHSCNGRRFEQEYYPAMACGGLGFGFVMSFKTLRFQDYYGIGYVHGPDEPGNTPSLTIGKCSKLEDRGRELHAGRCQ